MFKLFVNSQSYRNLFVYNKYYTYFIDNDYGVFNFNIKSIS